MFWIALGACLVALLLLIAFSGDEEATASLTESPPSDSCCRNKANSPVSQPSVAERTSQCCRSAPESVATNRCGTESSTVTESVCPADNHVQKAQKAADAILRAVETLVVTSDAVDAFAADANECSQVIDDTSQENTCEPVSEVAEVTGSFSYESSYDPPALEPSAVDSSGSSCDSGGNDGGNSCDSGTSCDSGISCFSSDSSYESSDSHDGGSDW